MPSISIFVHDLGATGVVRNAFAIAARLERSGWQVRLVALRSSGVLAQLAPGIETVCLKAGKARLKRGLDLALGVAALRRHVLETRPDVLLSAGNHAHLACVAACAGLKRPLRVYRVSNDIAHGREGERVRPSAWLRRTLFRLIVADAARLVLVSPRLAEEPPLSEPAARAKSVTIENGVDVGRVRAMAAESCDEPWFDQDVPVVLGVGRMAEQKNIPALVEAVALANRARPVRLLLLGEGSAEAREAIAAQAQRCGIATQVKFHDAVANPFAFMRRAAALALPSLWEGSPNVLLEALACGAPVVASHTAGNADGILAHGRYGELVDPLDPQAIADALLRQCDPATRILPEDRADAFDLEQCLARYEAVLTDLVTAGAAAPPSASYPSAGSRSLYR